MAKKIGVSTVSGHDDWRVESDLNTLIEAEKIRKDAKRLAKVQALAKSKVLEVAAVASESDED